jgi:polyisoprenoid-binding protein YceI
MKQKILVVSLFFVLSLPVFVFGAAWQIDPDHSSFQFKIRHLTVSNVKGNFSKVIKGSLLFDDKDIPATKGEVVIDAASVNTSHAKRDEHLRGPDFFDVARYPTITFVSRQVTQTGPDQLRVVGDLTLHGVTREIAIDLQGPTPEVKDPWQSFRRGFTGATKINRKDFGMTWNKALDSGGMIVGDEVEISVEIEIVRK